MIKECTLFCIARRLIMSITNMNIMKTILIIYLILSGSITYSQDRIFYKATDVNSPAISGQGIKKIRTPWGNHGRFLLLIKNDGSKTKIRKKELWGFQNTKYKTLRFYQGNTYELVDSSDIIILYKTYSPTPVYYFSRDLESKTFLVGRKKMIKILGIDRFIQLYKKSPLIRTLA